MQYDNDLYNNYLFTKIVFIIAPVSGFYLEIIFWGEVDFQSCGLATCFIDIR